MRRLLAITVIAAMILATGVPAWAAACTTMNSGRGKTLMCHRTGTHHNHCEEMVEQQGENDASGNKATFRGPSEDCPMQCCAQLQSGNGTATPAISFLPQLAVSDDRIESSSIVFLTNGFSSHTDRGPPVA